MAQPGRDGGHVGFVGVFHDTQILGGDLFYAAVHIHGGPTPGRRYLPELIGLVWTREIDAGKVLDLTLCPSTRWRTATASWTSAAPSECCSAHE